MRYMLMINNDEAAMAAMPIEKAQQMSAAYGAYTEALKQSGAWLAGERLRPTQATTSVSPSGLTRGPNGPSRRVSSRLSIVSFMRSR